MYIPETIRVVITKRKMVEVYSTDPGHEGDPPLPTASVVVTFTDMNGTSIRVSYGSSYRAIGKPAPTRVDVSYDVDKVTFTVLES